MFRTATSATSRSPAAPRLSTQANDRTTVVELIDELERKGAVVRKRNPTDRRSYALNLTPRGRTVQKRASRAFDDAANEFFDSIKPTERQALAEMLRRLITSADQKLKNG